MIIQINNLSKTYSPEKKQPISVLKDISMSVQKGESVAVTGSSGSGKTTFLTLVAGLDSPTDGEIKIIDQPIHSMSENELTLFRSRHIGFIFQKFHLLPHFSALENVALPLEILRRDNAEEKAREVLDQVGLGGRLEHLPEELSGGECQRIAIARAIVSEPDLILADEPTGNLDQETAENVSKLMFKLVKEKSLTMLLVTHNIELAEQCDRRLNLVKGSFQ